MGRHSKHTLKDYRYRGRHRAPVSAGKSVAYCMIGISIMGASISSLWNSVPSYLDPPQPAPAYVPPVPTDLALASTSAASSSPVTPPPTPTRALAGPQRLTQSELSASLPTSTTTTTQPPDLPAPEPPPTTTAPPKAVHQLQRTTNCKDVSSLRLEPHAAEAIQDIVAATEFTGRLGGREPRPDNPSSDHPHGLAVDLGTSNLKVGNRIRDYALDNENRLAIKYVLWQVDDHYDHVHISFKDAPGKRFEPRC